MHEQSGGEGFFIESSHTSHAGLQMCRLAVAAACHEQQNVTECQVSIFGKLFVMASHIFFHIQSLTRKRCIYENKYVSTLKLHIISFISIGKERHELFYIGKKKLYEMEVEGVLNLQSNALLNVPQIQHHTCVKEARRFSH
jgi:hypothetical protein